MACACAALTPGGVRAEPPPESAPVQLALLPPVQLVPERGDVSALRLSLLRGINRNVQGVDFSGATTLTRGTFRGFQIAPVNEVDGDCSGVQLGLFVNDVDGRLAGVQLASIATYSGQGSGVQIALFMSQAEELRGFQLGLLNLAKDMKGLQLGLLNFNENGFLPVFPIFNFGF